MGAKIFSAYSWSSKILFLFLICLLQYVHISNAYAYCQFYKPGEPWPYIKQCEQVCCPLNRNTRINTTCCLPPPTPAPIITTYTVVRHNWWAVILCVACVACALCILVRSYKRIHAAKHWKHFNSTVDPTAAFTISKDNSNTKSVGYCTANNDVIILENPPRYTSPVPPPPYTSVDPITKKVLE